MQHISLEISKLIHEAVPEVAVKAPLYCGGHTWYDFNKEGTFEECAEKEPVIGEDHYCGSASLVCEKVYPAYDLHSLFRAIKALGEKRGWKSEEELSSARRMGWNSTVQALQHRLLALLIPCDFNLQDPKVEDFIKQLFGNN